MGCKKRIAWKKYPLRVCRWLNSCRVCSRNIVAGESYFDGGYNIRAHEACGRHVCAERINYARLAEKKEAADGRAR
jgi:hypothetical protein